MDKIGTFFSKISVPFSISKKGQGQGRPTPSPPPPPPSCAPFKVTVPQCLDVIAIANLLAESKDNRKRIFGKFAEKDLQNNNSKLFTQFQYLISFIKLVVSYIKIVKSLNICFLLFVQHMKTIGSILIGLYYASWLCFYFDRETNFSRCSVRQFQD